MRFSINIYQDEDGVFIAECPSVPGCVSQGATLEEAETNIKDAIRECLEVRQELGMPLIVHSREVEVSI
ncbi:MAG TPA: type II toxin-antitoxin system HicB family antitoxin [Candidatus Kapabacteria bacterium]|nr:type II toxin-antitoxin system HicB family antitoxin [Candidatus Kapabacteria bacterium]